jgi:hypothetical protein
MSFLEEIEKEFDELEDDQTSEFSSLSREKMQVFLRSSLLKLLERVEEEVKNQKRDVLSQFVYQGAPTKGEVKKEKLKSEGYEIAKKDFLSRLHSLHSELTRR